MTVEKAKREWLAAGDAVDLARKVWADDNSDLNYYKYRVARAKEVIAFNAYLKVLG